MPPERYHSGSRARAHATPDGIKVTVHPDAASNQALTGSTRVFYMRVDGNKLTLKSPGVVIPTTGQTSVVRLELVKVD